MTILASPPLASLGAWLEQLVAESIGKQGKGIIPVDGEPLTAPASYGNDRLFAYFSLNGEADPEQERMVASLEQAGEPVVRITLDERYMLGQEFFRWELATAVAGSVMALNPFDQPDVESAKILAREMVAAYSETGALPEGQNSPPEPKVLDEFLSSVQPGDYIAIQAYVHPTPEVEAELQVLRLEARNRYKGKNRL